ncbi:MAG: hypothetical protein WC742_10700 [Gallionellaceae bacterium]|jgi:hypothetical protein
MKYKKLSIFLIVLCFPLILISRGALAEEGVWIINAGPSPHAYNPYGGITREYGQGSVRTFLTGGLGTIFWGGGVAWYANTDRTGLTAAATLGLLGWHVAVAGQLPLDAEKRWLLTAGYSYGVYMMQYQGGLPVLGLEYRL